MRIPGREPVPLRGCPVDQVTPARGAYLRQVGHYRAERLWYAGSVGQQPAKYLRAMEILTAEIGRREEERIDAQRSGARRAPAP